MVNIEVKVSDDDRKVLGGPEWVALDIDRLWNTPNSMLERWEDETGGYSIPRAIVEIEAGGRAPAKAKRVVLWLARKQAGANADAVDEDGRPESFTRLADVHSMSMMFRFKVDDADPPAESPQSSSPD